MVVKHTFAVRRLGSASFADRLDTHIRKTNEAFANITELFKNAGINDFEKLPEDNTVRGQFAKYFRRLHEYLEAAKIQRFTWRQLTYSTTDDKGVEKEVTLNFDEQTYLILALRYKELPTSGKGGGSDDVPYDIVNHLTEIDTGKIDSDYMNSRFQKYLKTLQNPSGHADVKDAVNELHKSFASLSQEEQKHANMFLNDVQRGEITLDHEKTFRQYVTEYSVNAKTAQIHKIVDILGGNDPENIAEFKHKLSRMLHTGITEANINAFGRFDDLKSYVDKTKAKRFFDKQENASFSVFKVNVKADKLLQDFVLNGVFDV